MLKLVLASSIVCLASACATLPEVEVVYYAPKSHTAITITQSLDCNHEHTHITVVNAVAATTTFVADRSRRYTIAYKDLDNTFADVDMTIALTDDGRLKTINANSTGQGEAIVKAAIDVGTKALAFYGTEMFKLGKHPRADRLKECDVIASWGKDKGVTLIYGAALDNGAVKGGGSFEVDPGSSDLYDQLKARLPALKVVARTSTPTPAATAYVGTSTTDSVWLYFANAARVQADVWSSGSPKPIWSGGVPITVAGEYKLPIPKPALFGKQTFALTVSDSGGIGSVGYGKGAGAVGALNTASAILGTPDTAATKAADLKAQADLIAQTQRLARCQAKPDTCT